MAAKNAYFEKVLRPELAKEKKPQDVKSIFAKSPPFAGEIAAVLTQFRREPLVKKTEALEIKPGGVGKTRWPTGRIQFLRSGALQDGFFLTRRDNSSPMASDVSKNRHGIQNRERRRCCETKKHFETKGYMILRAPTHRQMKPH
ncbi:MAG TPA: hypothetical protein VH597_15270 [Verrucomicrobiae bacterium]|nr:hypothetical protein [Verrucomicrobiae bacterium]